MELRRPADIGDWDPSLALPDRQAKAWRACQDPDRFVRSFFLTREDDSQGLLVPMHHQQIVLDAIREHSFVLCVKYRQAGISTIALAWLLGQVEYQAGLQGIFMAEKRETAEDVFRRAHGAYNKQPDWMRVPASRSGVRGIEFGHGGRLQVMTAGSDTPAIGQSVSRAVFTEFGFWRNQMRVIGHLFPSFLKRPNARIIGESTPGSHGCGYHKLVMDNWQNPEAQYHVVFLPWWEDGTCVARDAQRRVLDVRDFVPDQSELKLMNVMPGITSGHLMMRRQMLEFTFGGDERLFESKYPRSPLHGWYTTKSPAFPEDVLMAMLESALNDCGIEGSWSEPERGHRYLLLADPNSYGAVGDPSAHSLFDIDERAEVAAWSGRIDPIEYAGILAKIGKRFNNAVICVESNAAACVTALINTGYRNVWCADNNPDHPGYYRTKQAKDRAHGSFVTLTRSHGREQMIIRSRAGLQQCLAYDGTDKHGTEDGEGMHFDRVVTYLMAADLLQHYPFPVESRPLFDPVTGAPTLAAFKAHEKATRDRRGKKL